MMLFSYKMAYDTGFAPNPFHGILSLATCKSQIRLKKQVGDLVAGFTSRKLCNEKVGQERLVFIMRVTGKITFAEYWNDEKFEVKKPNRDSKTGRRGDNIYKPAGNNYTQVANYYHGASKMPDDLSGKYVLLSHDFFYFGIGAIPLDQFDINIPRFQSAHGIMTKNESAIEKLWNYLLASFPKNVPVNMPHIF